MSKAVKLKLEEALADFQVGMVCHNAMLWRLIWERVDKPVPVPEFIRQQAKGQMVMRDGEVWRKRK